MKSAVFKQIASNEKVRQELGDNPKEINTLNDGELI